MNNDIVKTGLHKGIGKEYSVMDDVVVYDVGGGGCGGRQ